MWKPADVMATMMIGTICFVICGAFVMYWVGGESVPLERVHVVEGLFVGMFGLVAYRMGKSSD